MINPRSSEFGCLLEECLAGIRWGLQTDNRILLFPASGTGGLEATVANLLSPGERAAFCTCGYFGDLWASIAEGYGVDVVRISAPWGEAADPAWLDRALSQSPGVLKVFITHCETSTGVVNDIAALSLVARRHGCLIAVDSISGVPCHRLPVDELGLDVVVTASQKGWLAPPGLTMAAVSDAAMRASAEARCPRFYLDFHRQASSHDRGVFHTTPPLPVLFALREGLDILRNEGLRQIWNRHARVATVARHGLQQLGLSLIATTGSCSNTVTAVRSPYATAGALAALLDDLRRADGLVLAAGLGPLEGHAFRLGHLGLVSEADIESALASLECALTRVVTQNRPHDHRHHAGVRRAISHQGVLGRRPLRSNSLAGRM